MKGKQRRWMAVFLSSVMTAVLMVQGVAPMQVNAAVSVNLQAQRPETGLELVTVGGQSMADEASMDNTITVVMEGNVGGRTSVARDFELTPTGEVLDISYDEDKEGDKHPPVASYPYCNSAIKPLVHVYDGEVLLHEKADYTISYKNNKNPYSFSRDKAPDNKTPVVIIKMKGNYSGEVRMYFGIEPLSLEGEGAYASPMGALIKDGKPVKVVPEVFYGLSKLKIGKDFIISSVKTAGTEYKNFDPAKGITVDKAGKYDVTLAGVNGVNGSRTGIYTGEIETTLEASSTKQPITKVSLGKNKTLKIDANGKETPPDLIVKAGTTELKNGTECHVASLVVCGEKNAQLFVYADEGSNYTGGKSIKVKVETASEIKEVVGDLTLPYTGEPQQFDFITEGNPKAGELKVLNNEGKALKEGEDFYAGYYNNSRTGKATLLILGGGKYCTSYISKKFSIVSSEKLTVNVEDEDPDKDGIQVHYCKGETKGKVTVSYTGNDKTYVLGEKTDYTLKYENNKATGKASVTATGKGAFKGAQGKCDFTIVEQTSEDSVFVDAADVILSAGLNGEKAKKTKITVTAQNGAKLKAGTDYEVAGFFIDEAMTAKLEDATVLKEGDVIFTKIAMKNGYGFDTKGAFRVYDKTNAIKAAKVAFQDNKNEVYGDKGYWFTGNAITPGYGDFEGTVLVDGRSDQFKASRASSENGYFIDPASYQKNVAKGTGSFMLYGTGKVGGSKKVSFKIVQKQFTNDRTHWDDEGSEESPIKSVTIKSGTTTVEKGGTITLSANVTREDGTDGGAVTWSSGSEGVATVGSTTGVVTGVEAGRAVITATSAVDPNFSDSVVISVFSYEKKTTQFNFVGLSANQMGGAVSSLTTADTPATTNFASGTYTIAGATVYCKDKGNVRARAAKNSTTAVNFNSGASKDVGDVGTKVSLSDFPAYVSVPVTGEGTITVNYQPYRSSKGSESAKFAIIDGSGNVISRAVINAKNESGGAGEKAVLTADVSEKGDYYIVYSRNGASGGGVDIFDVTVEAVEGEGSKVYVQEITITADPGTTIDVDGTATLTAAVIPSAATDPSVFWTSGNNGILTVDDNGDNTATITGVSNGVTNVYALALDGSNVEGSIEITVGEAEKTFATAVSITGADTVQAGYTTVFTANITPETASDRSVTWSSANEDIATVNSQGVVAGIKEGTAAITAVANGSEPGKPEVKSTKNITVTKASTGSIPVSGITVNGAAVLGVGTSTKYTATVSPSNASNKTVTWSLEWVDPPETADIDAATGVVTGVSEGTAVVKATANDGSGVSGTFDITVKSASAVTSDAIKITEAKGWLESAYVEWSPSTDATIDGYNVYYKGLSDSGWTKLDDQLIRGYSNTAGGKTVDYWRADALGLSAGSYQMKVVGTVGGSESPAAPETGVLTVLAQDRSGYAFKGKQTPGAYNSDGTLKANTEVIYVTAGNAKTVSLGEYTGLQNILSERSLKVQTTPLDIRIIGKISDSDMDELLSDEGLQVKNNKETCPITIEGVGEDATLHGFGILCRNSFYVEFRNFGVIMCMDDCISLDTKNLYTWVHNIDFFYGKTGGDSDQAKGDGSLDVKGNSQYQTFSYNHFWDSGKCSLCGLTESGPNYMTYHHNWFDHSDSRHPRIRTMTVHIYNNYYDGNSKYGVGVTLGADAFVEANYFRNVKFPMMSSLQGNDVYAGTGTYDPGNNGTFSKESGGSIKSYNNKIVDTNNGTSYWPYSATGGVVEGLTITKGEINTLPTGVDTSVHFDAYEVTDRNAVVPTSVTSFSGGDTYSNFDTASDFYSYTADSPDDAKANVEAYAGRVNGGDFKWTFDNATEDTNYSVIPELKADLLNYKSCLVKSGGGSGGGDEPAAMTADLDMSSYLDSINTAASSAEGVATVAFSGTTVTATRVSKGTATLTIAGVKDSQNATYTVEATVTDTAITFGDPVKKDVAQYVTVGDKVTVTASASTIGKGKSLTLTANLEKEYGEELTFKWTYSYDSGLDGGGIDATGAEEGLEIITGQTGPTCTYTPDQIGDYYFFVEVTGNTSAVTIDSYNADPPAKVTVTEAVLNPAVVTFSSSSSSDSRVTFSTAKSYGSDQTYSYGGTKYTTKNGAKLNSKGTLTLDLEARYKVTLVQGTDKTYSSGLKINDTVYAVESSGSNVVTATLNEGKYTVKQNSNETSVFLVILEAP